MSEQIDDQFEIEVLDQVILNLPDSPIDRFLRRLGFAKPRRVLNLFSEDMTAVRSTLPSGHSAVIVLPNELLHEVPSSRALARCFAESYATKRGSLIVVASDGLKVKVYP